MKYSPTLALASIVLLLGTSCVRPPSARAAENAPSASYALSPDDQLDITVLGHDDLKQNVTILPDGTFAYPHAGKVHAAGLTIYELAAVLTHDLSDIFNQPEVTVSVIQGRPRQISILGAVKTPGQYTIKPGWRLLDALAACGDLAQAPEMAQATLVTDGGTKSVPVDLPKLLESADMAQNLPLSPGDVLLVQPRDASVAQVQVSGEVLKPGSYPVPTTGASLTMLLNEAGGPTPKAALTQAEVMHDGQVRTVDLRPLLTSLGTSAGAVTLVAGDVLLVPVNAAKVAVMGDVRSPGFYVIPDGGTLPVSSALALAGGSVDTGDTKHIAIVRRDPSGKAALTMVDAQALLSGKSSAPDVPLQSGDILYVPTRHPGQSGAQILQNLSPLALFASVLHL